MEKLFAKSLILLGIIGSGHGYIGQLFRTWMSKIPDARLLSELSIPGTHSSLAYYGNLWTWSQSWTLEQQLNAGIRFLHIAVGYYGEIWHWLYYQNGQNLNDVVYPVKNFLKEHPTEVVLIRLKMDFYTSHVYTHVACAFRRHMPWEKVWNKVGNSDYMPTLGELRGKVVILQDFPGKSVGIPFSKVDRGGDEYEVHTVFHMTSKWYYVETHLNKAIAGDRRKLFLTYASGFGAFTNPQMVSSYINSWLRYHLQPMGDKRRKRLGIIAMDFPYREVIAEIIEFWPEIAVLTDSN